jgi:very-short-patch-repair endonuclease
MRQQQARVDEDAVTASPTPGPLGGVNFRRQHPVGSFILDFYCPKRNLCIEVDGAGFQQSE